MTTLGDSLEIISPKRIPLILTPKALTHIPIDNTLVGVELEIEHVNVERLNAAVDVQWLVKSFVFERDPSLRNNGIEIITKAGTTFNGALYNIYQLYEIIKTLHKEFGSFAISPRCSVHVHWNMLDKTEAELKTILLLYMAVEKAMFYVSGKRVHNIFCVPTLSNIPFSLTRKLLDPKEALALRLGRRPVLNIAWGKYSALNILPLCTQGTIEFRHHNGTLDYKEIQNWLITIQNLVTFAARFTSANELLKWLTDVVKTNNYGQLMSIFVETNNDLISRPVAYNTDLFDCIKKSTNKTVALCSCGADINHDDFLAETPKGSKQVVKKYKEPRQGQDNNWQFVPVNVPMEERNLDAVLEELPQPLRELEEERQRLILERERQALLDRIEDFRRNNPPRVANRRRVV